jgi:putrescine transport system permease protein
MRRRADKSALAAVLPYAWLAVLFLAPFVLVLKLSLSDTVIAMPPYAPRFDASDIRGFVAALDLETYRRFLDDRIYLLAYLSSLRLAAIATVVTALVGYPMALGIARCGRPARDRLVLLVVLPFVTSFLIRVYAWIAILKPAGLLNVVLQAVGVPATSLLYSDTAVLIGLIYAYLPFMVLPLYAVLEKADESLLEAAADLGASPLAAFWRVTFPLSLPGLAAGALLCFIPMVGEFVIPDLLGGSQTLMIGKTIWTDFFANRDWPAASAAAVVLLVTLVVPIVLYQRQQAKSQERA